MAIIILDWLVARADSAARVLGGPDGSRAAWVAAAASLGVVAATATSIVLVLRTPERLAPVALEPPAAPVIAEAAPAGTPGRGAQPTITSPTPAPTASPTAPPARASSAPDTPSPTAATAAPLTAAFAVTDNALLSYKAAVTIGNPGPDAAPRWTLVVTLPAESLEVTAVEGARVSRDGPMWTFVPDGPAGEVPGAGSHRVSFRVGGSSLSSLPVACTIDGVACTGLRG